MINSHECTAIYKPVSNILAFDEETCSFENYILVNAPLI